MAQRCVDSRILKVENSSSCNNRKISIIMGSGLVKAGSGWSRGSLG
jgi:hypothetical protein